MAPRTRSPKNAITSSPNYKLGVEEGRRQVKHEVLTYLQDKYVNGDFERGTPKAEAILQVAHDISAEVNR